MIRLTSCLLLATAALAQHYGSPAAPSSVPLDSDDNFHNRDMRIQPSSNFFYNFQQARIDQPLQVEVREENLGKYMGRPRPMTTTHIPILKKEHIPDAVHLHRHADMNTVSTITPYVPQGPYNAHLPATLPPPPATLKWMDLSDDSFKNHAHHKPSRFAVNPVKTNQAPTLPPMQPTQWNQPPSVPAPYDGMFSQQKPTPSSSSHHQPMYSNQMPQHYSSTDDVMNDRYIQEPVRGRGRGNHKFSWGDVALPETASPVTSTMPAPASHLERKRPTSIPTLSPWSGDSFGK